MLAKLIAVMILEVRLQMARMDPPLVQVDPGQRYDLTSTTAAQVERAGQWDHDVRPPARAFGFGFGFGVDRG